MDGGHLSWTPGMADGTYGVPQVDGEYYSAPRNERSSSSI
jgi:hypothetical protein